MFITKTMTEYLSLATSVQRCLEKVLSKESYETFCAQLQAVRNRCREASYSFSPVVSSARLQGYLNQKLQSIKVSLLESMIITMRATHVSVETKFTDAIRAIQKCCVGRSSDWFDVRDNQDSSSLCARFTRECDRVFRLAVRSKGNFSMTNTTSRKKSASHSLLMRTNNKALEEINAIEF